MTFSKMAGLTPAIVLATLIASSSMRADEAPSLLENYDVVWKTPSADAAGSMPVGNGEIALNAWVEPTGDLLFYIGKSDAWSGDTNSPSYGGYGLIKVGRVRISLSPNPFAAGPTFSQRLQLRSGTVQVSAESGGKTSQMTLWVDANHPVIHIDGNLAEKTSVTASVESWRTSPGPYLGADMILGGQKDRVVWYYRGLNRDIPQLKDRTIGCALTGDGLRSKDPSTLVSVEPGSSFHITLHPLTAQTASEAEWLSKLDAQIASNVQGPPEKARAEHTAWWNAFWNRSWIFITSGPKAFEVTQGYLLQRFKNACTSRGNFPIKFNGSLFTVDSPHPMVIRDRAKIKPDFTIPVTADYRDWGHQYWFQNTRPIYWPMMASGDYDLMQPLFRMYTAQLAANAPLIREYYGHGGSYFRETGPFWGGLENIPPQAGGNYTRHYYTPVLELSAMMLDYYDHTQDREFLHKTLIPTADAGVTFFAEHFHKDQSGKLVIQPANAIETYWAVRNPLPDIAGLHYVLGRLLALPEKDVADPSARDRWKTYLAQLPPLPMTNRDGKRMLVPYEEGQKTGKHNSENPELYAIYPFRLYGLGLPDFETAKNTFDARLSKWAGCWSQNAVQGALLGDAAGAQRDVTKHLASRDRRMRFPSFWPHGFDYVPDEDNGGNGLHALQTMLLQSRDNAITVLPAWPKNWDVQFKLHAPKMTTVEGTVRDGKLVDLKVDPPERRQDVSVSAPQ